MVGQWERRALGIVLLGSFVGTFLLTPLGFETRPVALFHPLGEATLVLVFTAVALNVAALALLSRKPVWAARLAALGPVLFAPALVVDQSGQFSSLSAPYRITVVEYAQLAVEVIAAILAFLVYRQGLQSRELGWRSAPKDGAPPRHD